MFMDWFVFDVVIFGIINDYDGDGVVLDDLKVNLGWL